MQFEHLWVLDWWLDKKYWNNYPQKIKQLINSDILNNNAKYLGFYSQFLKCDDFLPFCALHQTEYNLSWGHFKGKIDRLISSKYDCELNTVPWGKQDAFLEIYSIWFVLLLVAVWKPRRYSHLFPTIWEFLKAGLRNSCKWLNYTGNRMVVIVSGSSHDSVKRNK